MQPYRFHVRKMIFKKIESRRAHAGVIGLGYVGVPLMVAIANAGFRVTGIDVCHEKVERLKRGISGVPDVSVEMLGSLISGDRIQVTTDYSVVRELDTVNICVPTPLSVNRTPDIQFIVSAVKQIARYLQREQLIILESTTYPGTTEEIVLPILESAPEFSGARVGRDFYLAFSPERIEPGNSTYFISNTPKIVGGITPECTQLACYFYEQFINKTYTVSSSRTAEMVKLLENTFRSVNIGLINEIALICNLMDLDVWEMIDAAATKPFGFMPFYPGPGSGGHCIPIDPHYLSWKARTYQYHARFVELASEINGAMPKYVCDKIIDALNQRQKSLNGSNLLILGVAYKKEIGDIRESPAIEVIRLLLDKKANVVYHDPYVPSFALGDRKSYHSQRLTSELIKSVDGVVILTDHGVIDYGWVVAHSRFVVDTRNATGGIAYRRDKIIKI